MGSFRQFGLNRERTREEMDKAFKKLAALADSTCWRHEESEEEKSRRVSEAFRLASEILRKTYDREDILYMAASLSKRGEDKAARETTSILGMKGTFDEAEVAAILAEFCMKAARAFNDIETFRGIIHAFSQTPFGQLTYKVAYINQSRAYLEELLETDKTAANGENLTAHEKPEAKGADLIVKEKPEAFRQFADLLAKNKPEATGEYSTASEKPKANVTDSSAMEKSEATGEYSTEEIKPEARGKFADKTSTEKPEATAEKERDAAWAESGSTENSRPGAKPMNEARSDPRISPENLQPGDQARISSGRAADGSDNQDLPHWARTLFNLGAAGAGRASASPEARGEHSFSMKPEAVGKIRSELRDGAREGAIPQGDSHCSAGAPGDGQRSGIDLSESRRSEGDCGDDACPGDASD
ncbi:MAG: hypothetical protein HDQ93_03590 [Desulfovibrio sp.]|nr:hypothetical protein [Desulfovibrio sp.]